MFAKKVLHARLTERKYVKVLYDYGCGLWLALGAEQLVHNYLQNFMWQAGHLQMHGGVIVCLSG